MRSKSLHPYSGGQESVEARGHVVAMQPHSNACTTGSSQTIEVNMHTYTWQDCNHVHVRRQHIRLNGAELPAGGVGQSSMWPGHSGPRSANGVGGGIRGLTISHQTFPLPQHAWSTQLRNSIRNCMSACLLVRYCMHPMTPGKLPPIQQQTMHACKEHQKPACARCF